MQKQKQPKPSCEVCGKKIKQHRLCKKCNEMLGEGYEVHEILRYYNNPKGKGRSNIAFPLTSGVYIEENKRG
jgi:ribosomal protein L32